MIKYLNILSFVLFGNLVFGQTWKKEEIKNPLPQFENYEHYYWGDIGGESIYLFYNDANGKRLDGIFYYKKNLIPVSIGGPFKVSGLEIEFEGGERLVLDNDIESLHSYLGYWFDSTRTDSLKCNLFAFSEEFAWQARWLHAIIPVFDSATQSEEKSDTLDFELAYRFINMIHDDYTKGAYGHPDSTRLKEYSWPNGDYVIPTGFFIEEKFVMLTFECNLTATKEDWFKDRAITGEHIFTFDHFGFFINYFQLTGTYKPFPTGGVETFNTNSSWIKKSHEELYEFRRIEHYTRKNGTRGGGSAPIYYIKEDGVIYERPK